MKRLLDAYLLARPALRGWFEWGVLCLTGVAGLAVGTARLPLGPVPHIAGALLFASGMCLHLYSERSHREAHKRSSGLTAIVDRGMYARIRHPLYLSLIVMDLGIALAFAVPWTLIPAGVFSLLAVLTALREETYLLGRFPGRYGRYRARVRWRMIPGLF
jgi:protein-S-isoprenylcysteine O-methyltransferase Ste14